MTHAYHKQRYKKSWSVKGDKNTSFFHQAIIKRARRNTITHLQNTDGSFSTTQEQLAKTVNDYFTSIFRSSSQHAAQGTIQEWNQNEVLPEGIVEDAYTTSVLDIQELHNIVKNMRNNAAPGPDGLNAAFYKSAWEWVGKDVHQLVTDFYQTATMPPEINSTHIALIPKINAPITPQGF